MSTTQRGEWVNEQFLNGTSALRRPFSAIHDNSSVATRSQSKALSDLHRRPTTECPVEEWIKDGTHTIEALQFPWQWMHLLARNMLVGQVLKIRSRLFETVTVQDHVMTMSDGGQSHSPILSGFHLPRRQWSSLNHFRTGQGHCGTCQKKWGLTDNEMCDCANIQITSRHCQLMTSDKTWQRSTTSTHFKRRSYSRLADSISSHTSQCLCISDNMALHNSVTIIIIIFCPIFTFTRGRHVPEGV